MKKLVFMFVAFAAISFASCDSKKAEAPVVEEPVEVAAPEATLEDSTAAWAAVGDTTGLAAKDSIFAVKLDSIMQAKVAAPADSTAAEAPADSTVAAE